MKSPERVHVIVLLIITLLTCIIGTLAAYQEAGVRAAVAGSVGEISIFVLWLLLIREDTLGSH